MLSLLAESALRSLILAVVVGVILWILRVRNPYTQSLAWRGVLFAALIMPLLVNLSGRFMEKAPALSVVWVPPGAPLAAQPSSASPLTATSPFPWLFLALIAYGGVTAVMLLRIAIGLTRSRRLWRSAIQANETWAPGINVRVSSVIQLPATLGSTILLPADCSRWNDFERMAVIHHESCHVDRRDFYVFVMAAVHRAIFWFNPMAWWLLRRLVELAEMICDDAALQKLGDRESYAQVLLKFATRATDTRVFGVSMARGKTVGRRIERVVRETMLAVPSSAAGRFAVLSLLVPAVGFAAATWHESQPPFVVAFQTMAQTSTPRVAAAEQAGPPAQTGAPASTPAGAQRRETGNYLVNWPQAEVPYVITAPEREAFAKLKTDEEREIFIEAFWQLRDPTPATIDNEFRDEYYRRIVLANERFTSRTAGIPGWRSDRGRVLIQFGEPDEIESHPSGTLVELEQQTGRVININNSPFEIWRYKFLQGMGQNQILVFVDSTGEGIYRLQFDPAEKNGAQAR